MDFKEFKEKRKHEDYHSEEIKCEHCPFFSRATVEMDDHIVSDRYQNKEHYQVVTTLLFILASTLRRPRVETLTIEWIRDGKKQKFTEFLTLFLAKSPSREETKNCLETASKF